jgi:hypothetical protein
MGTHTRSRPIAALATVAVLVAAGAAGAGGTWTQVPSPNAPGSNELLGAGGADATHVWAVGRVVSNTAPSTWRSLILRWNGSAWAPAPHPGFASNHLFEDVDAPAPNDAWAVGNRWEASGGVATLIQRWNGASWSVVPSPNPSPGSINQLVGVRAVPSQPGTAWAVGSYDDPTTSFGESTLILRHLQGRWRVVPSPNVTADNHLEAVDATGPQDAWAVGWGSTSPFGGVAIPIVIRWNGRQWSNVTLPDPTQVMLFGVRALAPDDVWVVGHRYPGGPHWIPVILHWDGTEWTRATIPPFPQGGQLRDVVSRSPTNVDAVGFAGEGTNADTLVLQWNGASWAREPTPSPPVGSRLYGATIAGNTSWVAGYRYRPARNGNVTLTLRRFD